VLCRLYGLDGYLAGARDYVESYSERTGAARAAFRVLGDVQAVLNLILAEVPSESLKVAA
jgi:hypothetical protein